MQKNSRRAFLSSAVAGAAAVTALPAQADDRVNPIGVTGYGYKLPKLAQGSTLLFQGDSITDMKWGRNQRDRNHYLGHSFAFLIAARLQADMPAAALNFLNRGISGNTVAELQARWQQDAIELAPDVLTILVGINDAGRALRLSKKVDDVAYERSYRDLLTQSRRANPKLALVLLEPFVLAGGKRTGLRAEAERLRPVVARLAIEFDAALIKTQDLFDRAALQGGAEHWIWDGVHPLPQGHELIARHWIATVADKWA